MSHILKEKSRVEISGLPSYSLNTDRYFNKTLEVRTPPHDPYRVEIGLWYNSGSGDMFKRNCDIWTTLSDEDVDALFDFLSEIKLRRATRTNTTQAKNTDKGDVVRDEGC